MRSSRNVNLSDYTNGNKSRPRFQIDNLKINHKDIYKELLNKFDLNNINGRDLNGNILQQIIETVYTKEEDKFLLEKIHFLEKSRKFRNTSAHTIMYVTKDEVQQKIGKIEELEVYFKYLIKRCYPNINPDKFEIALNVYRTIENYIVDEFEKEIQTKYDEENNG